MIAMGTAPARLTAYTRLPVENPEMCRRPDRIASICAA